MSLGETLRRLLEIVLDQRSVSDKTIAPQIDSAWKDGDVCRRTAKLIADTEYASDRWTITDEGRAALAAG